MFDFNGYIVGEFGKFAVQRFDQRDGMANSIEKIRIAKCNVLSARRDLLADVGENNFPIHDAKNAVIDGNNRAMTAQMLATAAGLGVTHGTVLPGRQNEMRVRAQRRQASAIGNLEAQSLQRNVGVERMNLREGG